MTLPDPLAMALEELREISAAEFEDYRHRIDVRSARMERLTPPVCVVFTGAKQQRIWRIDTLDGTRTHYFVLRNVDIYS